MFGALELCQETQNSIGSFLSSKAKKIRLPKLDLQIDTYKVKEKRKQEVVWHLLYSSKSI